MDVLVQYEEISSVGTSGSRDWLTAKITGNGAPG